MTKNQKQTTTPRLAAETPRQPFIEHLYELRRRLSIVALSVIIFGVAAYAVEHSIIAVLLRPTHHQQFIYTSPGGGVDFLFRVCLYIGIIGSIPVIVYQSMRYIEPIIGRHNRRLILGGSACSGVLAIVGIIFGYYVSLPNALHFLLNQFVTQQIRPLLTIQAYMSFVTVFMLGSALLFQAPLIIFLINRIKPLTPQQLLRKERWVFLGAVIIAAMMNPTPNVFALLILVAPIFLTYQVGIFIVWVSYRRRTPAQVNVPLYRPVSKSPAQAYPLTLSQPTKPLVALKTNLEATAPKPIASSHQTPKKLAIDPMFSAAPHALPLAPRFVVRRQLEPLPRRPFSMMTPASRRLIQG